MKKIYTLLYCLLCFLFIQMEFLNAQCFPDRHNTSLNSSWVSCTKKTNPNSLHPLSHWILLELDEIKQVEGLQIWNLNHPDHLNEGTRILAVDHMNQNGEWVQHDRYTLDQANASGFYEGQILPIDIEFVSDRILLTLLENYGGACSGLSEIRLDLKETTTATEDVSEDHFDITTSPNPFRDFTTVRIQKLESRTILYQLINNLGQVIQTKEAEVQSGSTTLHIDGSDVPSGQFYLKIIDGAKVAFEKLTHIID